MDVRGAEMNYKESNLLKTVDGVKCPCPSTFSWGLQDVSASDAGRTQDDNVTMYKNRLAQKRKITLAWNGVGTEMTSKILKMFNPEYVSVEYWDAMDGCVETRTFYVGDRNAPVKIWNVNSKLYTSVGFDIIER